METVARVHVRIQQSSTVTMVRSGDRPVVVANSAAADGCDGNLGLRSMVWGLFAAGVYSILARRWASTLTLTVGACPAAAS